MQDSSFLLTSCLETYQTAAISKITVHKHTYNIYHLKTNQQF